MPLGPVVTLDDQIGTILMPQRLGRALLAGLGGIALLLAGVCIYGLVSCAVARTEKEIGVRRALGAPTVEVAYVVTRVTVWPVLVGIVVGSGLAWWGGRFADRFMYGIRGSDLTTLVLAVAVLTIAAAAGMLLITVASWLPARSAA